MKRPGGSKSKEDNRYGWQVAATGASAFQESAVQPSAASSRLLQL
jgi:hypothetical protein